MTRRISFLVHGDVQGVGFRFFTRKRATRAEITGWVRNTPNEKVEGEAQGTEEKIEEFITAIHTGPRSSTVSKVDLKDIDAVEGEEGFVVK